MNNFINPKNEELTIKIKYNQTKINSKLILKSLFNLDIDNDIDYNHTYQINFQGKLKEKIEGNVNIISDKLCEDNNDSNKYMELTIKLSVVYDRSKLDFDLYLLSLQDKITNAGYYNLHGTCSIEINHNGVYSSLVIL